MSALNVVPGVTSLFKVNAVSGLSIIPSASSAAVNLLPLLCFASSSRYRARLAFNGSAFDTAVDIGLVCSWSRSIERSSMLPSYKNATANRGAFWPVSLPGVDSLLPRQLALLPLFSIRCWYVCFPRARLLAMSGTRAASNCGMCPRCTDECMPVAPIFFETKPAAAVLLAVPVPVAAAS